MHRESPWKRVPDGDWSTRHNSHNVHNTLTLTLLLFCSPFHCLVKWECVRVSSPPSASVEQHSQCQLAHVVESTPRCELCQTLAAGVLRLRLALLRSLSSLAHYYTRSAAVLLIWNANEREESEQKEGNGEGALNPKLQHCTVYELYEYIQYTTYTIQYKKLRRTKGVTDSESS